MAALPEVSDVPLTEDILREKPKFIAGLYEWLREQGEQIFKSRGATGLMYTVPDEHILFITSAFICGAETSVGPTHGWMTLEKISATTSLEIVSAMIDHETKASPTVGNNSVSFPIPLRLGGGDQIQITSHFLTSRIATAGFIGFLVKKTIVDNLFL